MNQEITLFELNIKVKQALRNEFAQTFNIVAEISEMREGRGHAYLELIEKDDNGKIIAKARANIWARTYRMLKPYFESTTGHSLEAGIKVLVVVTVEYSEIYGLSLNIRDIDPTYTLGDIEKRKLQILKDLEEDGVIDMNKELEICEVPQNIAIISSETAAGYGDFLDQLQNNENNFKFNVKLFNAIMQGDKSEESIIEALDKINTDSTDFDIVAIIRGGGSKSDLSCFDNYWLAFNIAQFPLPIITGIGHERDNSITDIVAHTALKTPTAVAEFLISKLSAFENYLLSLEEDLKNVVSEVIDYEKNEISSSTYILKPLVMKILFEQKSLLSNFSYDIKTSAKHFINEKATDLKKFEQNVEYSVDYNIQQRVRGFEKMQNKLKNAVNNYIINEKHSLQIIEQKNKLLSPDNILKRGYSFTQVNGKLLKSKKQVKKGDLIITNLLDGKVKSKVE